MKAKKSQNGKSALEAVDTSSLINTENFKYIALIFGIWLVTYIICQVVFEQKLGWDEVSYLSVAKGIVEDFDFSSRAYTVMGILKQGYPSNLINFPVFSIYLAIFFKLFGVSLKVAYFSTWLAALGVCILIYFIFLLLSENNYKLSFFVSMSYLFSPGIIKNCDTALMEQAGCFLICLAVYLILRDYVKGIFNHVTILKFSISFLALWLFKSLFIGFFFGAFIFILLAYLPKLSGKKIETKIPLPVFLLLSYGIFVILFYILKKFVFLPVSPMLTFSDIQGAQQMYADFLGGALADFPNSLITNVKNFFSLIISHYLIYPHYYSQYASKIYLNPSNYVLVGVYFFLLYFMIVLAIASWSRLSPVSRLFFLLTVCTIICFNFIFNFLFTTTYGNIWRYNSYTLPLYLCCLFLSFRGNYDYIRPFIYDHPKAAVGLVFLFSIFCYGPLYFSSIINYLLVENIYYSEAKTNALVVKNFIRDSKPKFIYLNDGTHSIFIDYPIRQVIKEATNDQVLEMNKILPSSIEYLFLRQNDWLFKNNQEKIVKGEPIINDQYLFYGFDKDSLTVVYRLKSL